MRVSQSDPKYTLLKTRQQVLAEYGSVARQLVKGSQGDKQLAVELTQFVQTLPPVETQHQKRVAALKQQTQPQQDNGPKR